ncbi:MAG: hypothetical protein C0604_03290 [Clostridiales bacterium]|nr:MAG: hypothetical protein C0604_03290 [Clostridiales bacterium]
MVQFIAQGDGRGDKKRGLSRGPLVYRKAYIEIPGTVVKEILRESSINEDSFSFWVEMQKEGM